MKKILYFLRNIVISFFILYGFNVIASNFDIIVPINLITVLLVSVLGLPMLFSLVMFLVLIY